MIIHGEWLKVPGASSTALGLLSAIAPRELPVEYYQLLSYSNGGEGPLPVDPRYFILDTAECAASPAQVSLYEQAIPGLFVFGGNGAGALVAFDLRFDSTHWLVVSFDAIDPDGSTQVIAESFKAFAALIGRE